MSLDIYFYEQQKCPHCGLDIGEPKCVFDKNITHNLGNMAKEAGFYKELWHPEDQNTTARQLGDAIEAGIEKMKADPQRFKEFDASNGWGTYEQFLPWLSELLRACREYPDATLSASR